MNKDKMLERASDTKVDIPEVFAKNTAGYPQKVFELRQTLYCRAKQDPKYKFYTLYGLVCREDILMAAWRKVARNDGAPGLDGVSIDDIRNTAGGVEKLLEEIRQELLAKTYQPKEVKRVYIPKPNGKKRPLGIPTVRDRVVQAAVLLIIEPIFEADFMGCSYGYRPGCSAPQALNEIQDAIRSGCKQAYDMDMESFFDTIPHDKLIACVQKRIADGSIIKLIRMWLRSVVVEETGGGKPPKYSRPKQGTPQGGVISPLLANLYLHFFDVMFHKEYGPGTWARAKLVRYADDFVILSKHICERTKSFVEEALERRMGLRINRDKTAIRDLAQKGDNLEFLGYVFRREKAKQWKGWYDNLLPSKKALKTVRNKIKERTGPKVCFKPAKKVIAEVNAITRGWAQYFSIGYRAPAYHAVDNYVQLRLRKHLKRRSQRGYRRPAGTSWYSHLENLGMQRLSKRLAPVTAVR